MSLLDVRHLSVAFDDKRVVDDVSFSLAAGEKFALVGESGSGKTVTALSLLRLAHAQVDGTIEFAGKNIATASERELRVLRGADIAMIFQEPMSALNPLYTIGNQIVEVLQLHEGLSPRDAVARAIELLRQTGIPAPEQRFYSYPHQLSGGQRQRAMIAMALACKPKLLIADEPTTALDVSLRGQIIDLLDSLQQQYGMAILLITHDLNLVRRFAQRVGVMQHGKLVELAPTAQLFAAPQAEYTKRLLDARPRKLAPPLPAQVEQAHQWLLEAKHVVVDFPVSKGWFKKEHFRAVDHVDLHLRPGETLGIVGESGSGKSTLAMALLNLQDMAHGRVRFEGHDLHQQSRDALRTLRASMQVVFQDPFAALSPRMTIEQIVGEGLALHQPELGREQRRQQVIAMLEEVGLPASILQRYPHEFSGGQRQRIAIARAVILSPALLVLDEPTSALDVSVQKQVLELLAELQRRHQMSYLFISHDLEVIRAMSHRVLVMQDGKVVETGSAEEIFAQPQQAYTKKLVAAVYG
ncbi:MAG: ABC transporter ATP-binding protein [Burkholderiaceae bacterium]|nr:MAG: ABC transporter ATP-binding protein [Burkholderiaceae bacterium]